MKKQTLSVGIILGIILAICGVVAQYLITTSTPKSRKPTPTADPLREVGPLAGFKLPAKVREGDSGGVHAEGAALYQKAEELPHGLFMHGRILDSNGRPLSGVELQTTSPLWMSTTRETKFTQTFTFDHQYAVALPRKRGDFLFRKEGYNIMKLRIDPPLLTSGIDLQQSEMWRGSVVESLKSGDVLHIERDIIMYPRPTNPDVRVVDGYQTQLHFGAREESFYAEYAWKIGLDGVGWLNNQKELKAISVSIINDPEVPVASWPSSHYPVVYIRRVRSSESVRSGGIPSFDGDIIRGTRLDYQLPTGYHYELVMQGGDDGDGFSHWKLLRGVDQAIPFSDSFVTTAPADGYIPSIPIGADMLAQNYDGVPFEDGAVSFQWAPTLFLYYRVKGEYGVLALSSFSGQTTESSADMSISASVQIYHGGEQREIHASN